MPASAPTLLDLCRDPPPGRAGEVEFAGGRLAWTDAQIVAEVALLGERLVFDAESPGALQLSQTRWVSKPGSGFGGWIAARRRAEAQPALHVELRGRAGKIRLVAPVDRAAVLDGLPEIDGAGHEVALDVARNVLFTALHIGARIADLPDLEAPAAQPLAAEPKPESLRDLMRERRGKAPSGTEKKGRFGGPLDAESFDPTSAWGFRALGRWLGASRAGVGKIARVLAAFLLIPTAIALVVWAQRCSEDDPAEVHADTIEACAAHGPIGVEWAGQDTGADGAPLVLFETVSSQTSKPCFRTSTLDWQTGEVTHRTVIAANGEASQLWVLGLTDQGVLWVIGNDYLLWAIDTRTGEMLHTMDAIVDANPGLDETLTDYFHHGVMHVELASGDVLIDTNDGGHVRIDAATATAMPSPATRPPTGATYRACTASVRYAGFLPDDRWVGFVEARKRAPLSIGTVPVPNISERDRTKPEAAWSRMNRGGIESPLAASTGSFLDGKVFTACDDTPLHLDAPLRMLVGHQDKLGERGEPLLSLVEAGGATVWTSDALADSPIQAILLMDDLVLVYQGSRYAQTEHPAQILGLDPTSGAVRWVVE